MNKKLKKKRLKERRHSQGEKHSLASKFEQAVPTFSFPFPEAIESDENFQVWRQDLLQGIRNQSEELEDILLRYNAFNMVANLMTTQLFTNPETFKETTHQGLYAVVEYAALLYLKHPFNEGNVFVIDGAILNEVESRIRSILTAVNFYYASERRFTPLGEAEESLSHFRYRTISHEIFVRGPGYPHHQREQLKALFEPVLDWTLQHLGFTVDDAIAVDGVIDRVVFDKLLARRDKAIEGEHELLDALQAARNGNNVGLSNIEFIKHLKDLPKKKARKQIRSWMITWAASFFGTSVCSFTADDVASQSGVSLERVKALLDFFSTHFGSIPSDFFLPSPIHELRMKPFIRHDSTHIYPVPGSLIWAIQSRFEDSLKLNSSSTTGGQRDWKIYENNRARYLESEALRLLGSTLKCAEVYPDLSYEFLENGKLVKTQLDGLIIYDSTIFLIEAKAGAFSISARRGSRDRIKRDLKELLGKAHSQAVRAKRYIESAESPVFISKQGQNVFIDKNRFRRIFLVAVTLEPMDVFNAVLHEVAQTGLLEEDDLPWAISLDILRVICEINEFPTQLVHYLIRRLRINAFKKFSASDELDWFGLYLSNGLYFENDKRIEEADFIQFGSFSTVFDDYYFFELGLRKTPASKPVQPMHPIFRKIILELDARHKSDGHSEAVLQLLDWNGSTREDFVRLFERVRRLTQRDGYTHDFTLGFSKVKTGMTCFSTTSRKADQAWERLEPYIRLKKYQTHADEWLGLLTIVDQPGMIHGFISGNEPWCYDERLEDLAKPLPVPKTRKK